MVPLKVNDKPSSLKYPRSSSANRNQLQAPNCQSNFQPLSWEHHIHPANMAKQHTLDRTEKEMQNSDEAKRNKNQVPELEHSLSSS